MSNSRGQDRLAFLDGLRGIAILSVVIWHLWGPTYASSLPFGEQFSIFPIRIMWVGVELFFLISGFVILMTLEKSSGLFDFGARRWARLFPAMCVASLIILAFDRVMQLGPYADRSLRDLLPGLLFVSPEMLHAVFRVSLRSMDDVFWSLYAEVIFYVIFGATYFWFGKLRAIAVLLVLFVGSCSLETLADITQSPMLTKAAGVCGWLAFVRLGWFASGAAFYQYFTTRDSRWFALAIASGIASTYYGHFFRYSMTEHCALLSCVALFAAALLSPQLQRLLSMRVLLFFGFISYPLYLCHNNIGVGLTEWLGAYVPHGIAVLDPLLPIAVVTALSYGIAKWIEPNAQRLIKTLLLKPAQATIKVRNSSISPKRHTSIHLAR